MKLKTVIAAILSVSMLFFADINIAQAQWHALGSGYGVTTDWRGKDVPFGESVTAWAGTNDGKVKAVEFKWLDPIGNVIWDVNVPVFGPYITPGVPPGTPQEIINWASKNPGVEVWYATNTQSPLTAVGDWTVQAIFRDSGNIEKGQGNAIVAIRAPSALVVPEAPYGTIVTLLSMFVALAFATKRRKIFHF